jgi:hypothetical protein
VEAGGWRGEVQDAVGVDVVCAEGGTESCLRIGGGANWIGNIIGGTGLVGGLFSTQLPLALLLSSCSRHCFLHHPQSKYLFSHCSFNRDLHVCRHPRRSYGSGRTFSPSVQINLSLWHAPDFARL